MRRLLLFGAVLLLVLGTASSPAIAQQAAGDIAADPQGNPVATPPKYEVTQSGTLIIEGDVSISCQAIGTDELPPNATPEAIAKIKQGVERQKQACREAGFVTTEKLGVGMAAEQYPNDEAAEEGTVVLPDTGGPSGAALLPILGLALGSLGAVGVGLAHRRHSE